MTIFEYALLEAAREKMTPAELGIAKHTVEMVEQGVPGAREMLRKMLHEVLGLRYTQAPMARKAVE